MPPVASRILHQLPSCAGPLVTARWLKQALRTTVKSNESITVNTSSHNNSKIDSETTSIKIIDGSYLLPKRDFYASFIESRIPGACFFDIDDVCDKERMCACDVTYKPENDESSSPPSLLLPHMLPAQSVLRRWCIQNGIDFEKKASSEQMIVVYDSHELGIFGSPRVAWTFACHGFENVKVLDGGLKMWKEIGGNIESGEIVQKIEMGTEADIVETESADIGKSELVATFKQVEDASSGLSSVQILDARSKQRFSGEQGEPRPGLNRGHIPKSINIPFTSLKKENGTMLEPEDLRKVFSTADVDLDSPMIVSCGSGVTACVINLALRCVGASGPIAVYDGSFAEWGLTSNVVKNSAERD